MAVALLNAAGAMVRLAVDRINASVAIAKVAVAMVKQVVAKMNQL